MLKDRLWQVQVEVAQEPDNQVDCLVLVHRVALREKPGDHRQILHAHYRLAHPFVAVARQVHQYVQNLLLFTVKLSKDYNQCFVPFLCFKRVFEKYGDPLEDGRSVYEVEVADFLVLAERGRSEKAKHVHRQPRVSQHVQEARRLHVLK